MTGANKIRDELNNTQKIDLDKLYAVFALNDVFVNIECVVFLTASGNISVKAHNLSDNVSSGLKIEK